MRGCLSHPLNHQQDADDNDDCCEAYIIFSDHLFYFTTFLTVSSLFLSLFLKESKTESIGKDGDENKDFKPAAHIRTEGILSKAVFSLNLYPCFAEFERSLIKSVIEHSCASLYACCAVCRPADSGSSAQDCANRDILK